jgi:hypothetical protein
MSSSGIVPINSGPLIIRTYNDLSNNNTYLLQSFDQPVSSNYILITSNNGQLVPTSTPTISSITVGNTLRANTSIFSTIQTSSFASNSFQTTTISVGDISCSSITAQGTALFRGVIQNITSGSVIAVDSNYWGKYVFIRSNEDVQLTLLTGLDGVFMTIRNSAINSTTTLLNVNGGTRTLSNGSTITVMYNGSVSQWYSMTNN